MAVPLLYSINIIATGCQSENDYVIISYMGSHWGWIRSVEGAQMERPVTVSEVEDRLRRLPPEKLEVVYNFISFLLGREGEEFLSKTDSESFQTMVASEQVLRRDWDRPEEDAAWADL